MPAERTRRGILITRPREDGEALAAEIAARGGAAVIAPLLDIRFRGAPPALDGAQALAFTSANGVRALCHAMGDALPRALPVFAVGEATARAARDAGFEDVASAEGDVAALARLIARRCRKGGGDILHVAGSARAGDLAGDLAAAGFRARRAVLYEAAPAAELPVEAARAIRAGEIGAVLIFSPRTARQFVSLMAAAGLAAEAADMCLVALSPAVAEAARALPWKEVRIARAPDQESLLAEVPHLRASGK